MSSAYLWNTLTTRKGIPIENLLPHLLNWGEPLWMQSMILREEQFHALLKAWEVEGKKCFHRIELSCQGSLAGVDPSRWTGVLQGTGANTYLKPGWNWFQFGWAWELDLYTTIWGWAWNCGACSLSLLQKVLQCLVLICFVLTGDKAFCWSYQILWEIGLQESLPLQTLWQRRCCIEDLCPTCSLCCFWHCKREDLRSSIWHLCVHFVVSALFVFPT